MCSRHRGYFTVFKFHGLPIAAVVLLCAAANAEIGPCRPDSFKGLTCGEGDGAARVIEKTMSPSKRLAFAWRSPGQPPTEQPDPYAVDSLLIRLADGAVLLSAKGDYWHTGTLRVNRYELTTAWSPDSRFAVEILDFRWSTETLKLFSIGAADKPLVLDLKAIIEPAVRKHLRKAVKNHDDYAFSIFYSDKDKLPRLTIDNQGTIKTSVQMGVPKQESTLVFDVAFRAAERDGKLGAREISIRPARIKP